jgi:hypothetical protein
MVRRTFAAAMILGASASCAAVLGFERLSDDAPLDGGDDGGADTTPGIDASNGVCGEIGIAAKPDGGSSDDGGNVVIAAVRIFDLGIDTGGGPSGFNLDKTCSTDIATSSCTTEVDEATFAGYGKDFNAQGGDNAGFSLLQYLAQQGDSFKPASVNQRLQAGEYGIVVRVTRWNGLPDDPDVLVEIFPAIGVWKQLDGGTETDGGKPTFTAVDQWMRDERFRLAPGLDSSSIKSATAWITGGKLVATFPDLTFAVSVPDDPKKLDIHVRDAYVAGTLAADGGEYVTDVVAGGRWKTSDFLDQVRQIFVKNTLGVTNAYLCDPGPIQFAYNAVKKEACNGRDIRSVAVDDNKQQPCDAVSLGMRFDTYPVAEAGAFATGPTIPPRCVDAAVPAGDDCPPP